jgi:hypothetical protein
VGVGKWDGVGGDLEDGADTVGGRNTHSSDGGAGISTLFLLCHRDDPLYSPLTDVGREDELDIVTVLVVFTAATRHSPPRYS